MILYNGVRYPIDRPSPVNVSRLDHGIIPMVDMMTRTGVYVDIEHMDALTDELTGRMEDTTAEITKLVGAKHTVNPSSPKQVAELLFKKLGVQGDMQLAYTDSGAESTGADQLQLFEDQHPVVKLILDWRHFQKLRGTYSAKMADLARLDPLHRVHTRFKLTRAATGRLASDNPNLQNIPIRARKGLDKNYGKEVRRGFKARPGWVLVSMDLSQIEMRCAAHYSGEPVMIEGYRTPGFDMHSKTALDCGLCNADGTVDPIKHRTPAKTLGFGILYLMGPDGLQLAIVDAGGEYWPKSKCEALINTFYEARPFIREWQHKQFRRARQEGAVWTLMGRHRLIPQMKSPLGWQQKEGEREAANAPIQGFAQDILKVAMCHIHDLCIAYNAGLPEPQVVPLLQVHDELIFECASEDVAAEWVSIAKPIMEGGVPLDVPVMSSADVAERWGDLK